MAVDKLAKHDVVRKTMSATSSARIKEESNILRNIKKREMVSAVFSPDQIKTILSENENYEPVWKDSVFINECLDWHNLLRARHGVKQL